MILPLEATLLKTTDDVWAVEVDRLRTLLGAPENPLLFPPHFLKGTFKSIGGQIVLFHTEGEPRAVGFLFPQGRQADRHDVLMRFHWIGASLKADPALLCVLAEQLLPSTRVHFYDPQSEQSFDRTWAFVAGLGIGRPGAAEAVLIRDLQRQIWDSEPDFLYPLDIHSEGFSATTSLIARVDERVIGFLFGFVKFDGPALPATWHGRVCSDLRLESQALGVLPGYRGRGVATILKSMQAHQAIQAGIDVVNWTADPLQFGNAVLNYERLRAVAFDFFPDHYAFRNVLNRVRASRLGITWLVRSRRVRQALQATSGQEILSLAQLSTVQTLNDGWTIRPNRVMANTIAIEIPGNWTDLQARAPEESVLWRSTTDQLLQSHLGCLPGKYVVTGVGVEGPRRYILAQRVTAELLEMLAS